MRSIVVFVNAASRQQFTWRFNVGFDFALSIMYFAFQTMFFDRLFEFSGEASDWSPESTYSVFFAYALIVFASGAFFDSIEEFFKQVHRGRIDGHLVRPASVYTIMLFRWCNPTKMLLVGVLAIAGHLSPLVNALQMAAVENVGLFWTGVLVAVLCNVSFFVLLHLPTFLYARVPPADYILSEVRQLSILPIHAIPAKVLPLMLMFAPIACGASVASHILRFGVDTVAILFVLGTAFLALGTATLTRLALLRRNAFGG